MSLVCNSVKVVVNNRFIIIIIICVIVVTEVVVVVASFYIVTCNDQRLSAVQWHVVSVSLCSVYP